MEKSWEGKRGRKTEKYSYVGWPKDALKERQLIWLQSRTRNSEENDHQLMIMTTDYGDDYDKYIHLFIKNDIFLLPV